MYDQLFKPIEILLVEDNPGDVRLAKVALDESKVRNNLYHVENGEEAIAFLRKEGQYAQTPHPDLILLDLNLPKLDGREVLSIIKKDENLKRIPVVVLTVSDNEEDILKSYNLHANCYISKPLDFEAFIKVVQTINDFWLAIVKLPPNIK